MARMSVYGIRHHGAGSARNLVAALRDQAPDILLVECPADAQHLYIYVSEQLLSPPVAIMIYDQTDPTDYAYYPFTSFSPEWQAFQYATKHALPVVFFDLPLQNTLKLSEDRAIDNKAKRFVQDPFTFMARIAGFTDTERWWDQYIESQGTAPEMFDLIIELMREMRDASAEIKHVNLLREAYMRVQIQKAISLGFQNLAVICGAWHAPALQDLTNTGSDKKLLTGLKKVKTKSTWVPWSYNRIARHSGYESGVVSPYWYEALFEAPEEAVFRWMSRAGQMLNDMGNSFSAAHTIEASRLASALALMRNRPVPGIDELFDAVVTVHCQGDEMLVEKLRVKLLEGEKVGAVSDKIPMVPLRADLEAQIKKSRLTKDWKRQGHHEKKLDLRKTTQLAASRLFHRLLLMDIPWGTEGEIDHNPLGTFHEYWDLEWLPDYEIKIIEASMWGNTLEEACLTYTLKRLDAEENFGDLGDLLYRVLHANLPDLVSPVSKRIKDIGSLTEDAHLLMLIVPPLLWSLRYGDTARIDTTSVLTLLEDLFPRVCILLPAQVQQIADDVAHQYFAAAKDVQKSIHLTEQKKYLNMWLESLESIARTELSHPLLKGLAMKAIITQKVWSESQVIIKTKYELSHIHDPFYPAYFLEGILDGGGWLLIHRPALHSIIDGWFMQLTEEQFRQYLPILRRAFSTFTPSEKQMVMTMLDRVNEPPEKKLKIDEERAVVITPMLDHLLD